MSIFTIVIIAIIVYFIVIYNKFVSLNASIDSAWSDIDVQLKRRHNLIPSLINVVKGYKDYEKSALESVIKARQLGMESTGVKDKEKAENMLTNALGKIFALAEAYPDLKANETFIKLQVELSAIEEAIQNARRYYNAIVRDFNAKIDTFPDLLIAKKFNFTKKDYFEIEDKRVREMPDTNI